MAFRKAITISGFPEITEAYHRIMAFSINPVDKIAKIEIAVYYDEATRTANESNSLKGLPINAEIKNVDDEGVTTNKFNNFFSQTNSDMGVTGTDTLKTDIVKALYTWIKANVTFYSDATDV